MIELHGHNVQPVVWLWKPFHKYFVHFNKSWNIKRSTITAFSTFLLLSHTKVIFLLFGLLYKTFVYNGNGTVIAQSLTFDHAINFGTAHSPFALIAIIIIIVSQSHLSYCWPCIPQGCSKSFFNAIVAELHKLYICLLIHTRGASRIAQMALVLCQWCICCCICCGVYVALLPYTKECICHCICYTMHIAPHYPHVLPGLHYLLRESSSPVDQEAQSHGTFHH